MIHQYKVGLQEKKNGEREREREREREKPLFKRECGRIIRNL